MEAGSAGMTERMTIEVDGLVFDARADGPADGELVLMLHGFPESAAEWTHVLPSLGAAGYRAIAFDQRGYSPGARPEGIDPYHHTHLAQDVVDVAAALGTDRFHLVGHDWGALVAWSVGARRPEVVRSLAIVSVPHPRAFAAARAGDADQQERSAYIEFFRTPNTPEETFLADDAAGLRRAFEEIDPAIAAEHVRVLQDPGAMTAALNYYRAWDTSLDEVPAVEVPTLFVWSTDDVALGRDGAEHTADWVTGPYRFEVFDGLSHWIPEVAPDRLSALLVEHLRAHP
jgi:pimeloyl-ACP methyl ester carboxylesterase